MELPIYFYFLVFSAVAGVTVYFQHSTPLYLKLFPFFLLLTIFVELSANWMMRNWGTNMALYNFYLVCNFCFCLYMLREIITDRLMRKVGLITTCAYGLVALFNLIFVQKLHTWNSMSYSLGCLLVVAFCIYYFFELFKRPKATRLTKEPAFWIVSGLLFFYCCSFPFIGLNNFLGNAPLVIRRNLNTILTLLNILLYLLFGIAFLCRLRPRKPAL